MNWRFFEIGVCILTYQLNLTVPQAAICDMIAPNIMYRLTLTLSDPDYSEAGTLACICFVFFLTSFFY